MRSAKNVLPAQIGFKPLQAPAASSNAVDSTVYGSAVIIKNDGNAAQFCGEVLARQVVREVRCRKEQMTSERAQHC